MADLLSIERLRTGYGEAVVLPDMSLRLAEGEVLALLGRNGTGKTTLINSIVGNTRRFSGTIALGDTDITGLRLHRTSVGPGGIGWVPQERNIFRRLKVEENMTAVAQLDRGRPPGPARCLGGLNNAARQLRQTSFPAASSRCWRRSAAR